jgi:hypothetical protein
MNATTIRKMAQSNYPPMPGEHQQPTRQEWHAAATVHLAEIRIGYRDGIDTWKVSRLARTYANARACRESIAAAGLGGAS